MSTNWKRVVAGFVGLVYASIYGFWTILLTGGGHGNFFWLFLFLFSDVIGLYFPLMAVLAVDLRPRLTKIIFGSLLAFNVIASSMMIATWVTEVSDDYRPSDFSKVIEMFGLNSILFWAGIHFLPTFLFAFFLIRSIMRGESIIESERIIDLKLT